MPRYDLADCFEAPLTEQQLLSKILDEHGINSGRLKKCKVWVRPDGGRILEFDGDDYCSIGPRGYKEVPEEYTRRRKALGLPDMPPRPPAPSRQDSGPSWMSPPKIVDVIGGIPIVQTSPRSYLGDLDDSPEFGDD